MWWLIISKDKEIPKSPRRIGLLHHNNLKQVDKWKSQIDFEENLASSMKVCSKNMDDIHYGFT
jgi:hypothetical protein